MSLQPWREANMYTATQSAARIIVSSSLAAAAALERMQLVATTDQIIRNGHYYPFKAHAKVL